MSRSVAGLTIERVQEVLLDAAPEIRALQTGGATAPAGENPTGDDRIAADEVADQRLVERLADVGGVGQVASEEREEVVDAGDGLAVAVDPLDGSKNVATNNPTGTIVGVYDAELPARGRDLVAAGFVVYGPRTTAVIARGDQVTAYEIDKGQRQVLDADLEIPDDPTVVGIGGGDDDWPEPVAELADELRHELKLRYGGALVADVTQVLEYGGLFGYPQLRSSPQGKLRHQYEANPIAYVVEKAGGASTDGAQSVLDRAPSGLHARTPIYVGTESVVERVEERLGRTATEQRDVLGRRR